MIYLILCLLFIVLVSPIVYGLKKKVSFFSPLIIVFFLNFLFIFPYYFSLVIDNSLLDERVYSYLIQSGDGIDYYLIKFGFLYIFSLIFLFLGINIKFSVSGFKEILVVDRKYYRYFGFFLFFLGAILYLMFLNQVGGFFYVMENLQNRASFTSGNGYLNKGFLSLLSLSVIFLIYSYDKKTDLYFIFFSILLSFLIFSSLGGRKSGIVLILISALAWNFRVRVINKVNLVFLSIIFFFSIYVLAVPILRKEGALEYYVSNKGEFLQELFLGFGSFFKEFSYIDHYLFILYKFNSNNIWMGASFSDLLYSILPSKYFVNKPPVDDGVYVRTMVEYNNYLVPSIPFNQLYPSSWPPETFGNLYMNFLFPGVFLGMFILGMIYRFFYDLAVTRKNIFFVATYASCIFVFHFSNLRIVQFISDILVYLIVYVIFIISYKVLTRG